MPPRVEIIEQPASKALRFRYECEERPAGSIPGEHSTADKKVYPSIKVVGFKGHAVVVVSCVTASEPYKPHPHHLVDKKFCSDGICTMALDPETMSATFNFGIKCVRRKDVNESLELRKKKRVDPFKNGYEFKKNELHLNCLRLCFQVFIALDGKQARTALPPVVSNIIYDKKANIDLTISKLSACSGKAGDEIILLCEKVSQTDIAVVFLEMQKDQVVWEHEAAITLVHKQTAIAFKVPAYRDTDLDKLVFLQLRKPSEPNMTSNLMEFEIKSAISGKAHYRKINNKILTIKTSSTVSIASDDYNNNAPSTQTPLEEVSNKYTESYTSEYTNGTVPIADDASEQGGINKLLDQVAELDEIYTENRTRIENLASLERKELNEEIVEDGGMYSSIQLAYKNPINIKEQQVNATSYEDIMTPISPTILIRDEGEKLPPLPPKRIRKDHETNSLGGLPITTIEAETVLNLRREPMMRTASVKTMPPLHTPKEEPPKPKKRSFLSRLFRRRKKKSPPPAEEKSERVARSVSSVSGRRPTKYQSGTHTSHLSLPESCGAVSLGAISYADSVTHISLHESPQHSRKSIPADLASEGKVLIAESVLAMDTEAWERLKAELDLQETDQYALYVDAPLATMSECDAQNLRSPRSKRPRTESKELMPCLRNNLSTSPHQGYIDQLQPIDTVKAEINDPLYGQDFRVPPMNPYAFYQPPPQQAYAGSNVTPLPTVYPAQYQHQNCFDASGSQAQPSNRDAFSELGNSAPPNEPLISLESMDMLLNQESVTGMVESLSDTLLRLTAV